MEACSAREADSSCRSWSPGVNAAEAIAMPAITSGALAGSATFTARPLHFDKIVRAKLSTGKCEAGAVSDGRNNDTILSNLVRPQLDANVS